MNLTWKKYLYFMLHNYDIPFEQFYLKKFISEATFLISSLILNKLIWNITFLKKDGLVYVFLKRICNFFINFQ